MPHPDDEIRKAELQHRMGAHAHEELNSFNRDVGDAARDSGLLTLRVAMLINGGAAISMLAFLGALATKVDVKDLAPLASTIAWFA